MISRNRSISSAAARSIERTTSANSTVTCLYSACVSGSTTGEPQPWQNRAFARGSAPHVRQTVAAVIATSPAAVEPKPRHHDSGRPALQRSDPSLTSTSCHRRAELSVISPGGPRCDSRSPSADGSPHEGTHRNRGPAQTSNEACAANRPQRSTKGIKVLPGASKAILRQGVWTWNQLRTAGHGWATRESAPLPRPWISRTPPLPQRVSPRRSPTPCPARRTTVPALPR